jgi:hypothetical protein
MDMVRDRHFVKTAGFNTGSYNHFIYNLTFAMTMSISRSKC